MSLPRLRRRLLAALIALPATAFAQNAVLKTGTWWNPSEPGWGLFTSDQGGVIAPGWFTYDDDGEPTWFLVPGAALQSDGSYRGELFRYRGVPFPLITGNAADPGERIGDVELRFSGNDALSFRYTVGGTTQTKSLVKFPFGDRELVCRANDGPSRASATNYSDLWWSGASGSPGWGVHISHIDNALFATWYTYDADREAIFMVAALTRQADGSFSGPVTRQRDGTPFRQINNAAASPGADPVGGASLRFSDGENGVFSYTIGTVSQAKTITRLQFGPVANVCETVAISMPVTECSPPLQIGDTWTTTFERSSGENDRYVATVAATSMYDGNPVFAIDYRGANRLGLRDYDELVEQRANEWIIYRRTGYIAELDVDGTLTYNPPLRIPRSTPLNYRERRMYTATIDFRDGATDNTATIEFDHTILRSNSESVTTPAGTFSNACVFDTTLQLTTTIPQVGGPPRTSLEQGTRREWRHPTAGLVRELQDSVRNTPGTGGPSIQRVVVNGQLIEATIGGRRFP